MLTGVSPYLSYCPIPFARLAAKRLCMLSHSYAAVSSKLDCLSDVKAYTIQRKTGNGITIAFDPTCYFCGNTTTRSILKASSA